MRKFITCTLLAMTVATMTLPSWAISPVVNVSFNDSQRFTDIGINSSTASQSLRELQKAFEQFGKRYIGENQTLQIEVLDVTLAGRDRLLPPPYDEVRVLNGRADWPSIKLRYTLMADGQTLRSGNETLSDMDYQRGIVSINRDEPLYYEKRMIEDWFKDRFSKTTKP